eukprot:2921034-Pleurochrysis_carterae.AAC.1
MLVHSMNTASLQVRKRGDSERRLSRGPTHSAPAFLLALRTSHFALALALVLALAVALALSLALA